MRLVIAGLVGGLLLSACDPPPVTAVPIARRQVELRGVVIDRFAKDQLRDRTVVERAELDRAAGVVTGERVKSELYRKDGPLIPEAELVADRATSELGPKRVILEGAVRLADPQGRVVRTERLVYEGQAGTITTDQPVVLEGQNFRAEGRGLVGNLEAGTIELGPPVRAFIVPVDAQPLSDK
ncbi:MAG: LPS export ABC transporter periplasmic protein LptC [Deltaproteobacteria bacterium]|nr:LPS export ABC transporter periplasmic protein LptC [Deltaproteobacteria bacterium]